MKKVLTAAAVLSVAATATFANTSFPIQMTKNGVVYNCAADLVVIDGVQTRQCIVAGATNTSGAGVFNGGVSGSQFAAITAFGIIGGFAASQKNDNSPTNSTTGTN